MSDQNPGSENTPDQENNGEIQSWGPGVGDGNQSLVVRALTLVSAFFLFLMLAITFFDVIGRYFLNAPITGAHEIIAFLLGLTIFTALPLVTLDRGHITVGMFERFYKGPVRYIIHLVVLLGTLAVVGFIAWLMFDQAETMREADFITEYLDMPQAPIVYVLSGLGVFACVIFLGVIWRYIQDGGDPEEKSGPNISVSG
ncbi:MAG: TRAP transporter small permease [Rhodospirillaceae bacterium]|jgi:TRAP-type transport system small permease protein|nr:TRAP transporter small permease [Rhodospirillaceae bacterium]MBT4589395.1 TRAP transporter small permease [Rhodospirillaceae bacterium]MBT4937928.1 TRAP transporter small permease [Rhodospirillaceae bacterium]MBT5939485.1 TRAP transporter small permease [Rhodospirillaceae bacterium]MBT7267313.1 TRAP transporter small permease [Rhodospirillaceae bacterium]